MRILLVTNIYPTGEATGRGLPNARLLRHVGPEHVCRLIVARPRILPPYADGVRRHAGPPLDEDARFQPRVCHVPHLPRCGGLLDHRLFAYGLRRAFAAVLAEGRPDAILVPWLFPDMCGVARLAEPQGIPVFGIAMGSDVHLYLRMPRRRGLIRQGCATAAGIVARSRDLAAQLAAVGVPPAKLRTVYNGVETDLFRPGARQQARAELGLPATAPVLLYVGNLLGVKNPGLLLEALRGLPADAHVVYVGEGPLDSRLRIHAAELGAAERVRFAGHQRPERVAAYMRAANLLVVPSRNEGIPNVIREAFACGLPVVATDVGGIGEILAEDWLGTLVPSEDAPALARAIASWLVRAPDAGRIRAHAESFSWTRTVEECLAFVRERIAAR